MNAQRSRRLATAAVAMLALATPLALSGCTSGERHSANRGTQAPPAYDAPRPSTGAGPTASDIARASAAAAKLSDLDLVGQVLVPYAFGADANLVTATAAKANRSLAGVDTPAEMIAKFRLGGMILVAFSSGDPTASTNATTNIVSATQVRALTAGMQAAAAKLPAAAPLLIGTDQEYGVVNRIKTGIVQLPSAMAIGAAADPSLTRDAWAAAGGDLAAVGLNVDFAPDADVIATPANTVIGSRSFGSDPKAVSAQVSAAVSGLQSAGVAATLKHFPGHGDTDVDSHLALPVLSQPLDRLTANDLAPFRAGIKAGVSMIMSGHLDVKSVDPGLPASFSSKVLTDMLRTQMGFQGVVISDALNMGPAEKWGLGESAVRAFLAGNDMLLMPPDLPKAQQALLAAAKSGRIPHQRLLDSVTRILALKYHLASAPAARGGLNSAADRAAVDKLAAASITVFQGPCRGGLASGGAVSIADAGWHAQRQWLAEALKADGVVVTPSGGTVISLIGYSDGKDDMAPNATITVAMDTPYMLREATSPIRIATYSASQASMTALAAVLSGKTSAPGRSPTPVDGMPASACDRG
jgi:beta-N-acetylhexosaminidase